MLHGLARAHLRLRNALADLPERLGLRATHAHRNIVDQFLLQRFAETAFEQLGQAFALRVGQLDERVKGMDRA
ncbi:hypothetical protein D3C87_1581780 [compost metagenome]